MTPEETILELIRTRKKYRPIKNKAIAQNVFLINGKRLSERRVKEIIKSLRDEGYPILASREKPSGYFWAQSVEELKAYETTYLKQAKNEFRTMRRMRKNYQILSGQQSLI